MKNYLTATVLILFFIVTNIISFSQGYFLGKIDIDFLFASNNARNSTERLRLFKEGNENAIEKVVYSDQETLSRIIALYGKYLENGPKHFHKFFFLDFSEFYLHKNQYEEWVKEAVMYRVKNPIMLNDQPINPFHSELEFYLNKEDIFPQDTINYLRTEADYYDLAIQHTQENLNSSD